MTCSKCNDEISNLHKLLVASLSQITSMYEQIDRLEGENLVLRHTISHSDKMNAEVRSLLEGK